MTGSGWRLLVFLSFTLLTLALRAQMVADQSAARQAVGTGSPDVPVSPQPMSRLAWPPQPQSSGAAGQAPAIRGTIAFPQIVRAAGIIFSGKVTSVGPPGGGAASSPANAYSTAITFQVESAIRGTVAGQSLTIHEWSALWTKDKWRYRVGEHVFLFLYPPSRLGLTSPVAAGVGKFAIDSQGRIALNALNIAPLAQDPIIGGRQIVPYTDFVEAIRRAGGLR